MANLYKTTSSIPLMVSRRVKIVTALIVIVALLTVYCVYASSHAFDLKGEPKSYPFEMTVEDQTLQTTLITYLGGDPAKMVNFTLVNPDVKRIYILFRASEVETDNPFLLKASASVGEGLGAAIGKGKLHITAEDIHPRQITWFQRVLIYSGFMGTPSEPVIYFVTPNLGGTENRIIVTKGIVIIESSTYENSIILASFVRQVVMS